MFEYTKQYINDQFAKHLVTYLKKELKHQETVYNRTVADLKSTLSETGKDYAEFRREAETWTSKCDGILYQPPCFVLHDYEVRIEYLKIQIDAIQRFGVRII